MSATGRLAEAALGPALTQAIATACAAPVTLEQLQPLAGGASQEAWAVTATIASGAWAGCHELVLRRDLGGALSSVVLDRATEFAVLQVVHAAGIPTPRPYWYWPDLTGDGRAAFLMERLAGETIGRRIVRAPSLTAARAALTAQMGATLAAIHAVPASRLPATLRRPAVGQTPAQAALAWLGADLATLAEPHPVLSLALRWLERQAPPDGEVTLVHGDFRVGNLVVGPTGLRAVLDWEVAHLGDPHEDLAWACLRAWRFGQDTWPVGGVGQRADLYTAYERASHRRLDRQRLFYWEVLGNLGWALGALGQARRHLSGAQPSVELAVLGRVAAEVELELLALLAPEGHRPVPVSEPSTPPTAGWSDRPTAAELVAAVRDFLLNEVAAAATDQRQRFRALVAANALTIVGRELDEPTARWAAEWARLAPLTGAALAAPPDLPAAVIAQRQALGGLIRAGLADDEPGRAAVIDYLYWSVSQRLRLSNPDYLARFDPTAGRADQWPHSAGMIT